MSYARWICAECLKDYSKKSGATLPGESGNIHTCGKCGCSLFMRVLVTVTERLGSVPGLPLDHIDNGPYLPGKKPRKKPDPKSPEELADIRRRAWETRRKPKETA
jgi:hypothetical protein